MPQRYTIHCYGNSMKRVLFLKMNPGSFGMAQNGVAVFNLVHFAPHVGVITLPDYELTRGGIFVHVLGN